MKIVDYRLIAVGSDDSLEDKVNNAICDGWQPFGAVCANTDDQERECFYQAMVKYELPPCVELTEKEFLYVQEVLLNDFMTREAIFRHDLNSAKAVKFIKIRDSLKRKFKIED